MADFSNTQRHHLLDNLHAVIADAESLLTSTAGQVGDGAADARDRIDARLKQAKESLSQLKDSAYANTTAATHAADAYVHHNPWRVIGAAAGLGLVVGLLIGRR